MGLNIEKSLLWPKLIVEISRETQKSNIQEDD